MASIRSRQAGPLTRVTVIGTLSAADTGRLEHACASALTAETLSLELDLRRVTAIDRTAEALLARMVERGAHVRYGDMLVMPGSIRNQQ